MRKYVSVGLVVGLIGALMVVTAAAAQREYLAGYLIIPIEKVDKSYNAGFSMYVPAWPLQRTYPGHNFQSGLPGTWMFPQHDTPPPFKFYSDVEGGLGWWRDTQFPTETPKFVMGGVGPDFSVIANGPAHGWGTWEKPRGLYGVAQLSPWLLFPIDGLNIKQGASGEFFGYGYLNLPLCDARKLVVDGKEIPTGGNCWTLFISAANFKGPVAFFTPLFWAEACITKDPKFAGLLLDSCPAEPNRAVQMETQWIPCRVAKDSKGESYARIAPTLFPLNENDMSVVVHKDTVYNNKALYDSVKAWFEGGPVCKGAINPEGAFERQFVRRGYATWQIHMPGQDGKETRIDIDWNSFATPIPLAKDTYAYQWNFKIAKKDGKFVVLPEYYHLENPGDGKKPKWVPVPPDKVPAETGLHQLKFERPVEKKPQPYTTPEDPQSCWKKPGPKAGPFKVKLGDGSVVTYYWYRFADQPAMLKAGLTDEERERMQAKVEKLHREWSKDRAYLPLPSRGKLAEVDPAQLVTPPKGLEYGYVPIATKQGYEE